VTPKETYSYGKNSKREQESLIIWRVTMDIDTLIVYCNIINPGEEKSK
jgi:hypothetical protein